MIEFTVPPPPSTNHLYFNVAGRGRVKTSAYKAWLEEAGWAAKKQRLASFGGPVAVTYIVPEDRRRDLDNYCKGLGDLLQSLNILQNDSQIDELRVARAARKDVLVNVCMLVRIP